MEKKFKFGKKFIATFLVFSILEGGLCGYKLYKRSEVVRVKGYLEDFLTEENYVDLSKISKSYNIKGFSGEALREALEELDIRYVRITDSYVYDEAHVLPFTQKTATDYAVCLGRDENGNLVYMMYEPIRESSDKGVVYRYPEGYVLEDIDVEAEPIRFGDLDNREVVVHENEYEESYSLELKKHD